MAELVIPLTLIVREIKAINDRYPDPVLRLDDGTNLTVDRDWCYRQKVGVGAYHVSCEHEDEAWVWTKEVYDEKRRAHSPGKQTDGYHTIDELYEHRFALYLLAACYAGLDDMCVWMSRVHHDGTSYDGWFILGIEFGPGKQISYHLPDRFWEPIVSSNMSVQVLDRGLEWDGHTSQDVIDRIYSIIPMTYPKPQEVSCETPKKSNNDSENSEESTPAT